MEQTVTVGGEWELQMGRLLAKRKSNQRLGSICRLQDMGVKYPPPMCMNTGSPADGTVYEDVKTLRCAISRSLGLLFKCYTHFRFPPSSLSPYTPVELPLFYAFLLQQNTPSENMSQNQPCLPFFQDKNKLTSTQSYHTLWSQVDLMLFLLSWLVFRLVINTFFFYL